MFPQAPSLGGVDDSPLWGVDKPRPPAETTHGAERHDHRHAGGAETLPLVVRPAVGGGEKWTLPGTVHTTLHSAPTPGPALSGAGSSHRAQRRRRLYLDPVHGGRCSPGRPRPEVPRSPPRPTEKVRGERPVGPALMGTHHPIEDGEIHGRNRRTAQHTVTGTCHSTYSTFNDTSSATFSYSCGGDGSGSGADVRASGAPGTD